jgi:myo-inositol-1(or 4)-monophosphatase
MTNERPDQPGQTTDGAYCQQIEAEMHHLADLSGAVILPFFRQNLKVDEKHEKGFYDPVTEADRAAEQVMRTHIEGHFPDHGIVGEEFGRLNEEARHCWIFDPIDGTRAFIIGAPTWGTLIGLNEQGRPSFGMMNQPFTRERFWGGPQGAFYRGPDIDASQQQLHTSATTTLDAAILATTAPDYFTQEEAQRFTVLSQRTRMTRYGYDCYAYCLLAMGRLELVAETGLACYDIAPLIPVIEAAGGVVTTWQGGDASNGGQVLASANADLHEQALQVLGG